MSARTRRSLTLLWVALFVFSLLLQYVSLAAPQSVLAVHDEGLFELDGNTVNDSGTPGDDWDSHPGATGSRSLFVTDPLDQQTDEIFTGGGSKDDLNTDQWAHTTGSVPDKDNIEHAFAASYVNGSGHTFVYFGLDRYSNGGDAFTGFWFFKNGISTTADGFTPKHSVGDLLVLSNFTNGGGTSTIQLFEWVGVGGDTNGTLDLIASGQDCTGSPAVDKACAVTNSGDITPSWTFDDKAAKGTNNPIPAESFFEGGIDLDQLFNGSAPCFNGFLAETRASQSVDAVLKDYALGAFNTCEPPNIETHVQQGGQNVSSINLSESVVDVADLSSNDPLPTGSIDFFVCGPSNSNPDCTSGGTKVGATKTLNGSGLATSDSFTPTQTGHYCFRAVYTPDDAGSNHYVGGSHTNTTTECFEVLPAVIHIAKTADASPVNAGDPIGFTVTINNSGTGKAFGVTVDDPLPTQAGLSWSIDGAGSDPGWSISAGHLVFGPATLNAGASSHVHMTSPTTPASCATIPNSAHVGTTNDGQGDASASVVVNCPDVKVTKTPDGASVNAGDPITWAIKVENLGPGLAKGVTLTDPLPAGVAWSESEADCSISGSVGSQVLNCTVGDLASGASKTYHVTGTTDKTDCGVIDNTATASATNEPSDKLANNTDSGDVTVLCAQIDLTKTPDQGTVSAGTSIGFTITATNNGAGLAHGVTITDTLPANAGLSWSIDAAGSDSGCSISSGVLTCTFGDLAAGASKHVHITSPTTKDSCGVVDNTGHVTTTNDGSDDASASITVNCPVIDVAKTADAATVNAGDPIGFTVTLSNTGDGNAVGLSFSDPLPGGAGISWSINPASPDWTITGSAPNQSLHYTPTTLAAHTTATVHVVSGTTGESCKSYDNTATASATNDGSDSASASTTVICPDVSVVKSADNSPISAGDTAAFTITVSNAGPGVAKNVTVNDPLPAGVTWVIDPAVAGCSISSGTLTCNFASLAAEQSVEIHVHGATVAANCGLLPNTVTVGASNEPQEATGNNQSSAEIEVDCPELVLTKTADAETVNAGEQIGFTIEVTNNGEGTAQGVTVTDTLPANGGLSWSIDAAGSDSGCSISSGVLTCNFGSLAPDGSKHVHITSPTTADSCALIPNTASATTSNDGSASDDASVTVLCPDVSVVKTADNSPISAGDTAAFTITVSNAGPGVASDVTLHDPLPAGVAWSIDPAVEGCAITSNTLDCSWPSLDPEQTVIIHISGQTDSADCGTLPNTATVAASNEPENATDDNQSSATIVVNCPDVSVVKTADNSPISAGDTAAFTITVSNAGPGVASDVTLHDPLPAGVAWSIDPAVEGCAITSNTLDCSWPSLDPEQTVIIHISGQTDSADCGTLPNTATVAASNEPENATDDNQSSATIVVNCASIAITKVADAHVVEAGNQIGFTITVSNAGPGTATGVHVNDPLPTDAGTSWSIDGAPTGDTTGLTCAIAAGTLTCDKATLEAGHSFSLHIVSPTTTDTVADSPVDNTAFVTTTNDGSDQDSDSVRVPQLTIAKSVAGNTGGTDPTLNLPVAKIGDTLTYTLAYTLTNGPVDNGVITDVLPVGLQYVDGSATGNEDFSFTSYDSATRTLRWDAESVTASGTVTYKVTVLAAAADQPQPLTNTATIDSDETAPSSDQQSVLVAPPPLPATATPKVTLPPTDTLDSGSQQGSGNPGFTLMLVLLGLAGLALGLGAITPVPERVARRNRRR